MLNMLEELDRRVWDGRHMLEDVTHVLGGAGVGLLVYSAVARWARPIGYALIGLSVLLHVYALVTAPSRVSVTERITRLVA